jgi:hypothetical protein
MSVRARRQRSRGMQAVEEDDPLRALCRAEPSLTAAVSHMLDRFERRGHWTRTITVPSAPGLDAALRQAFSGAAIKPISRGLVVDVARVKSVMPPDAAAGTSTDMLAVRLYRAIGRSPRDARSEAHTRRLEVERTLGEALAQARTSVSRHWIEAELGMLSRAQGELGHGTWAPTELRRLVHDVVRTIDAALVNESPIRAQTFSAKVLGSSKLLRPGSDLFRIASAALYDHDAATRQLVALSGDPHSINAARRDALEARGIYRDEVAASVLCFGPIVYRKGAQRFDHVARHARLGESSRLIQHQLRDAVLERPSARRVTIFENLTPYLDYVDAVVTREIQGEIVVCASGQASWAVVRLLELCAKHGLPMRLAADLDRSGVLILRSLRKRAGARIEPLCMGVVTHRRFAARGQALTTKESAALDAMLDRDSPEAPGHALLREIAKTKVWIEQEAFSDECLARVLER